ncbi:MAG: hypothetical protein H6716_23380 [Polyangiaceae bacterium]|nr:hypothetical protein [Polyangiaceae bacterium]
MLCTQCHFDLSELPTSLPVDAHVAEHGRQIGCPLCGQPNNFKPSEHGVFLRESADGVRRIHVWDLGIGPSLKLRDGGLTLAVDAPATIRPDDVVPSSVLSFRNEEGNVVLPFLAAHPKFLDCIDLERSQQGGPTVRRVDARTASITLYLKGVPDRAVTLQRPILTNPWDATKDATFENVNVRMWPPPMPRRRRYLFGVSDAGGGAAVGSGRVHVGVVVGNETLVRYSTSTQDGGHVRTGAVSSGLPRWIQVEYRDRDQLVGASAFLVQDPSAPDQGARSFGLDFGTSNTCVAFKAEREPSQLPIVAEKDFSYYAVLGGEERRELDGTTLWPRPKGFGAQANGRGADLLATELWFESRVDLAARLEQPEKLVYGLDYGLGYVSVVPSEAGEKVIRSVTVTGFKWLESTPVDLQQCVTQLQRLYVAAFLDWATVRVALGDATSAAQSYDVSYCVPLAFDDGSSTRFDEAVKAACSDLTSATGSAWKEMRSDLDEGRAAAQIDQNQSEMTVIADMGGGTTDIAALFHPVVRGVSKDLLYNTSIRYAGETLIGAYQSVLLRGDTLALRRAIRESSDIRVLFKRADLFSAAQSDTRDVRTREFYGYVLELVARMIAATLIEGHAVVDGRFLSPMRVRVLPLGNGWAMAGTLGKDSLDMIALAVESRVRALLEATPEAQQVRDADGLTASNVQVVVTAMTPSNLPHVKAAVAYGLLNARGGAGDEVGPKAGTLLGLDTTRNGTTHDRWFLGVGASNVENVFARRLERGRKGPPSPPVPAAAAPSQPVDDLFALPTATQPVVGRVVTFTWGSGQHQGEVLAVRGTDVEIALRRAMGTMELALADLKVFEGDLFALPGAPPQSGSRVSYTTTGRTLVGTVSNVAVGGTTATVQFDEVRVVVDAATVQFGAAQPQVAASQAPSQTPAASPSREHWLTTLPEGVREGTVFGWGEWKPALGGSMLQRTHHLLNAKAEQSLQNECKVSNGDWYRRSPFELLLEHVVGPGIGNL